MVQLNTAVYGLVNAPSAWRKTVVRGIDPCIFCLMGESGPQGHILIEVDDLATHGNTVHVEEHGEAPEDLQVWQVEEHLKR